MAKHYYNIELISSVFLEEEEIAEIEEALHRTLTSATDGRGIGRTLIEYVDSEG